MNVNLRAVFLLAQAVFPDMREKSRGTIITVGSVAGRRGWANASAYCASKFALTGLVQTLAAEGKPHRINAFLLYPGAMDTNWGAWTPKTATEQEKLRLRRVASARTRSGPDHLDRPITARYGSERNHHHPLLKGWP